MRFLFVVHKNEEKAEQNSVLFHRLTLKERGLRPNGYFPLMRQPLALFFIYFEKSIKLQVTLMQPAFQLLFPLKSSAYSSSVSLVIVIPVYPKITETIGLSQLRIAYGM